jgi:hypothetical protein
MRSSDYYLFSVGLHSGTFYGFYSSFVDGFLRNVLECSIFNTIYIGCPLLPVHSFLSCSVVQSDR